MVDEAFSAFGIMEETVWLFLMVCRCMILPFSSSTISVEVRLHLEDAVFGIGRGHPCVQLASLLALLLGHDHHF